MQVAPLRFSYIESPTLRANTGALTSAEKNSVMSETSGATKAFSMREVPWERTALEKFLHGPYVISGHEFNNGVRLGINYVRTNVLIVDLDDTLTPGQAIDILTKLPDSPLYHLSYSSNHKPDGPYKMHIIMPLSTPVTSQADHALLAAWVLETFKDCDHKVRTDVARGIIRSNPAFMDATNMGGKAPLDIPAILEYAKTIRIKTILTEQQEATASLPKGKAYTFSLDTTVFDADRNEFKVAELVKILRTEEFLDKPYEFRKIPIFCPQCGFDTQVRSEKDSTLLKQNAFIRVGKNEIPYINCQSCGSRGAGADKKGSYFLENAEQAKLAQEINGFLIFRDRLTDTWYDYTYSKRSNARRLNKLRSLTSVAITFKDRAKVPPPELHMLPQVELAMEFHNKKEIDLDDGFVNLYVRPDVLKQADDLIPTLTECPPVPNYIGKLIHHVTGKDDFMYEKYLNWLAYIFQNRCKTYVSWLFQGTQGTGKDYVYTQIIKPIFGENYCADLRLEQLNVNFNAVLEDNLFMVVNEVYADFSVGGSAMSSMLKTLISEKSAEVERKNVERYHGKNNVNVLFHCNVFDGIILETGDRRFNVCERQEEKLEHCEWLPTNGDPKAFEPYIAAELLAFCLHLGKRPVPPKTETATFMNDAKKRLMAITKSYTEDFFDHVKFNFIDWEWLYDHINEVPQHLPAARATQIVSERLGRPKDHPSRRFILKREAQILYSNIVKEGTPVSAMKFDKLLLPAKMKAERISVNGVREFVLVPLTWDRSGKFSW